MMLAASLGATEVVNKPNWAPSAQVARDLVSKFDQDNSSGLDALELSDAMNFLSEQHPFLSSRLDYTATAGQVSAAPKVAVGLVEGFDSNGDVQLTREELSLAITYLRKLERDYRGLVASAQ